MVSKKKRRHKEPGFDLDLSYITTRIIAMGFPSTGNEGIFRNHADHVTDFLSQKHGEKVKVYNLCSERDYPVSLFNGRVAKYPFDDHNPPPMQMFLPFCEDVKQWLDSDPENVVAIHCKAGKGRTGVMICAYMLYIGEWDDADECMAFYGVARTYNGKGVTIPSQKRFIRHFADLCPALHGRGGSDFKNNVGTAMPYTDEIAKLPVTSQQGNDHICSESDEDDSERESNTNANTKNDNNDNRESNIESCNDGMSLGKVENDDTGCDGGGMVVGDLTVEVSDAKGTESSAERPVVVTSQGTVFTDYSDTGSNLEENLKKARVAANSSKVGRRPTYAQASFWMSKNQETVHQIFLDSGVPGGLLGSDESGGSDVVLALEDVKPVQNSSTRERGQVLPPVVLAVLEMRLSAVPLLNLRGSFQPVFRIQGAGYSIWSTDFLPDQTYRGKGAITFAIPGNSNVA